MKKTPAGLSLLFAVIIVLLSFTSARAAPIPVPDTPAPALAALFNDPAGSPPYDPAPGAVRSREAVVDTGWLGGESGPPLNGSGLGERVTLNLFADTILVALLDRLEQNRSGSYTWIGHIAGQSDSQVIFVVRHGWIVGHIFANSAEYDVRFGGNGTQIISQVDTSQILNDATDYLPVETIAPPFSEAPLPIAPDDGSIVDLMVVYSDDAAAANPGILSEIELAVAYTNQAYERSGVNQRLFLVHTEEVTYTETGDLGLDLDAVTDFDGNIDSVHTSRNTYHADETIFLVDDDGNAGGCSGLAWLQTTVSMAFQSNAFGAMGNCLSYGAVVFAHELGHNMGARHDWFENGGPAAVTPYAYAHGYVDSGNLFRTIMAYNSLCAYLGVGTCTRIPYFSTDSGSVTYNGNAVGVSDAGPTNCLDGQAPPVDSGAPDPETCAADATQTFNNTAATVAAFRSSQITWVGTTSSDWNTAANWEIEEGAPGATTTVNRVPRDIDDVVIPSGAPNAPAISGNLVARSITIQTGAALSMSSGTLTVSGDWEEQGTGAFTATGGTIVFASTADLSITTSALSTFNDVQLGDGSTQLISLSGLMDVNGAFTISAGATFSLGSATLQVAGSYTDNTLTTQMGSGTTVFDGTSQTISQATSAQILSQDFSAYDGPPDNSFTNGAPAGWSVIDEADGSGSPFSGEWTFGDWTFAPNSPNSDGLAFRWYDSTATFVDTWLFTPEITLQTGITYTISFDYGVATGAGAQDFSVHYGTAANAAAMTTQVFTATGVNNTAWAAGTGSFTVPSTGSYYLGFRNYKATAPSSQAAIDDITLTAVRDLSFNNLTVNSSSALQLPSDTAVGGDLTVGSSGVLDLNGNRLWVDGTMANSGRVLQTKDAPNGVQTSFLTIENKAGSATTYWGVEITPTGGMGSTSVTIDGGQTCPTQASTTVERCFDITPTTAQTAQIRFYYRTAEANGNSAPEVFHYNGTMWLQEALGTRGGSGDGLYVTVTGVDEYSPFALADSTPTTIQLASMTIADSAAVDWVLAAAAALTLVGVGSYWRRRARRRRALTQF